MLNFNRKFAMIKHEFNKHWQTAVNTIRDGIMIVDMDGTIVSANRAVGKTSGCA